MSEPLLWIVTVIYGAVSISLLLEGKSSLSLVFFGYTIGNLGFIWSIR